MDRSKQLVEPGHILWPPKHQVAHGEKPPDRRIHLLRPVILPAQELIEVLELLAMIAQQLRNPVDHEPRLGIRHQRLVPALRVPDSIWERRGPQTPDDLVLTECHRGWW